jgi:hypothetical protein
MNNSNIKNINEKATASVLNTRKLSDLESQVDESPQPETEKFKSYLGESIIASILSICCLVKLY